MLKQKTTSAAAPTRLLRLRRYPLPLYVPQANRRWICSKILRDNFEPDILTKPLQPFLRFWANHKGGAPEQQPGQVSTLLEILVVPSLTGRSYVVIINVSTLLEILARGRRRAKASPAGWIVLTLLEILARAAQGFPEEAPKAFFVSTLLEILVDGLEDRQVEYNVKMFQPFLRF